MPEFLVSQERGAPWKIVELEEGETHCRGVLLPPEGSSLRSMVRRLFQVYEFGNREAQICADGALSDFNQFLRTHHALVEAQQALQTAQAALDKNLPS